MLVEHHIGSYYKSQDGCHHYAIGAQHLAKSKAWNPKREQTTQPRNDKQITARRQVHSKPMQQHFEHIAYRKIIYCMIVGHKYHLAHGKYHHKAKQNFDYEIYTAFHCTKLV